MSSNENNNTGSALVNLLKAILLVVLAVLAFKFISSIIGLIITLAVVLGIGVLIYGLFRGIKKN